MITVKAKDFSSKTTDANRERWSGADMAALIEALDGGEVMIETDNQTGCTVRGTLVAVRSQYHASPQVLIKGEGHPAGGIWYRLWNCGNVVVLDNFGRAKWDALTIYREQRGAAISQAVAEHGEGRHWGEWTARPLGSARTFMVSYEPHTGNPAAAAMYGGSGTKLYGVMVTANA